MDFLTIEKKWNEKWQKDNLYKFDDKNLDKKYYLLEMFSYPSGASLHLGHWWNFGLSDSFGRFKRLQGYNVFHPMGFDAFGLPAENYALKTGIHPEDSTKKNIEIMERQFREMGGTFNWDYELITCNPDYYKWTQWVFIQLFKRGLAYQKEAVVNFCPKCNTIIANEQVVNGHCERCESEILHKNMKQWFFKITDYAEELLTGLDKIDWPEKTKTLQRNWIGKSVGAEVDFYTETGEKLTVFTSRADTLYGVSFLVIAPENKLVQKLIKDEQRMAVEEYIQQAAKKDEIERTSTTSPKTGVFTGSYVINPLTNEKVPVFVADYVIATYATGIVMGVAAHDERDYDFAKKYDLMIKRVVKGTSDELPFCDYGTLCNSAEFDGLSSEEAKTKIVEKLEKIGKGRFKTNYRLRDWSVARQRYWGCPIPIIHCEHCGAVPVPEKDLPVKLPHIFDWKPEGEGPLGKCEEFMNTICPVCGKPARREADTMDTFVDSSFYQLRYPASQHIDDKIFDKETENKMLPVDCYVGGVEHATGHLLYSRFITKFLRDIGCLDFDEPFKRLVHQGMILGNDGKKMSKRNGAKTADDYIAEFGSDALRLHMMFSLKYIDGGIWSDDNVKHMKAFMERVERICTKWAKLEGEATPNTKAEKDLEFALHKAIKDVAESFEEFSFNVAVARYMELVNAMYKYDTVQEKNVALCKDVMRKLLVLMAPATPHFSEEMWEQIGEKYSVHNQKYPTFDGSKIVLDKIEIAVQVNSKIVARIEVENNLPNEEVLKIVKLNDKVSGLIEGKSIVKEVVVPNRIVNLIVK
ncbi:MAG: leucine--tRNA ligase [Clostridiales bacterium]|nr:leucine--tRNA ligase [Clostridiales bacterium]